MVVLCWKVLILSEKLHSVTLQFDQLRATRFQDIINRALQVQFIQLWPRGTQRMQVLPEAIEPDEIQAQPRRIQQQQQLLDDETQALQVTRQLYMVY